MLSHAHVFQVIHVTSSILTLGFLLLAACQALALFYYDYALRHKKLPAWGRTPPDLESMERRLFQIIFVGFLLLTGIIASSTYFFALQGPMLFLKLSVSLLTWVIFAGLLGWRYRYGLRGRIAIWATLLGVGIVLGISVTSFIW